MCENFNFEAPVSTGFEIVPCDNSTNWKVLKACGTGPEILTTAQYVIGSLSTAFGVWMLATLPKVEVHGFTILKNGGRGNSTIDLAKVHLYTFLLPPASLLAVDCVFEVRYSAPPTAF